MKAVNLNMLAAGAIALAVHHTTQSGLHQEAPAAKFTKDTMPGTPQAVASIINLTIQYFLVYTALAATRTWNQFYGTALGPQKLIESACQTVNYCPMLCVLFLGARMRADQLSGGDNDRFNLPTTETRHAMSYAAWSVLVQLLMVLLIPVFTGELSVPVDADGNVDMDKLEAKMSKTVAGVLTAVRYIVLGLLYGATVYVVYAVHTMEAPAEVFPGGTPPVSAAMYATIILTSQFFVVYFLLAVCRTWVQFMGPGKQVNKLAGGLKLAAYTVNMAPMLCILFIAARMRSLQIDPTGNGLQPWAQNCFYACAYSVMAQALLVIALPYTGSDVQCVRGDFEGDVKFVGLTGYGATFLVALRYAALLGLYGGFSGVCYAVFSMQSADPAATPKVSPAMSCVINLVAQYFTIYLFLFLSQTIRSYYPSSALTTVGLMMENARATVMYAPMLSIMFLAARMRALQLARASDDTMPLTAGPPLWMQQCMFLATWAVLIQIVLVIVFSCLYTVEMDADGNLKTPKGVNPYTGYALSFLRYSSMLAMYGGSCAIMYGTVNMTPETVQPYNVTPLPIDVPQPPAPELPAVEVSFLQK